MNNDSIVYTKSDKGLGIYAVEFSNYIQLGLKESTNKTYYEFTTEEQAWTEIYQLKQDIIQRTVNSRGDVDKEIVEYIKTSMKTATKDSFA